MYRYVISIVTMFMVAGATAQGPRHVYLTWQGDTSRTMTVTFQTEGQIAEAVVLYDEESRGGAQERYAHRAAAVSKSFEGVRTPRFIHTAELRDLKPGTAYHFVAGDASGGFSRELKFRTIPEGDAAIRFFAGGDMDVRPIVGQLLAEASKRDPMFGLIGGDVAYANGDLRNHRKWDRWLDMWFENAITPDGCLVPMVLGIGNHEVVDGYNGTPEKAPFYFGYFPQGGSTYFARRFGANVGVVVLDTGHIASHESQAAWLGEQLAAFRGVANTYAVYHVPLYPSHRGFNDGLMVAGRRHWAPVFDQYRLTAAFENHDHTLKRTPRIKANRIDPSGTLYLGDGCLGQEPRDVDAERRWYEEIAVSVPHFWHVEADANGSRYTAIGAGGATLDSVSLP